MKKIIFLSLIFCLFALRMLKAEGFKVSERFNLNSDVVYVIPSHSFAIGQGITIGSFCKEVFEIRGEYVFSIEDNQADKAGLGLGLNIRKALESIGVKGIPDYINSSAGTLLLLDLKDEPELNWGFYLTALKIEF